MVSRSRRQTIKARPMPVAIAAKISHDSSKKTGADDSGNPYFYGSIMRAAMNKENPYAFMGNFMAAQDMVPAVELYASSFTPKGAFLTRVAPRNAFRSDWKFVPYKGSKEPLPDALVKRLRQLTKEYDLKKAVTMAVSVAEIFGRSLLYRRQISGVGKAKTYRLFVTYIPDEYVEYDNDDNFIKSFRPHVGWGMGAKNIEVKPEDSVLFIGEVDPMGNGFQGIPALLAPYRTIVRSENIEEAWSDNVTKRGLGLVDLEVDGAESEADLKPWVDKYGDPSSYNVMVHNERLKIQCTDGIKAAFDLNQTVNTYTEGVSASSGYPKNRILGNALGQVTGAENDQDNTAENYSALQERYEKAIVNVYKMLDPTLAEKEFELEWEFEIKMDRSRKANVFATDSGSIMTVQDIITVNQGLEILGFPALKDERGKMFIAEFIAKTGYPEGQAKIGTPLGEGFPLEGGENPKTEETEAKKEIAITKPASAPPAPTNTSPVAVASGDIADWLKKVVVADAENKIPTNMDKVTIITEGLKHFNLTKAQKDDVATELARVGTDIESQLSYKEINRVLTNIFGAGKSPNWLTDKRYK